MDVTPTMPYHTYIPIILLATVHVVTFRPSGGGAKEDPQNSRLG